LLELVVTVARRWNLILFGSLACGLTALGITYLIPPTFTARTMFLPPQQQSQSAAAAALGSLGALSGLAGVAGGIRNSGDQYVALMQSVTVQDRLIDEFKLMDVYQENLRVDARRTLERKARIAAGKKDSLITVEVDDHSPERAAAIANRYVDELRRLTGSLALTEAQQRRAFFEEQLHQTRDRLAAAQGALQASGFDAGSIRAEPRAVADAYARLRAEVTAAEVKLQTLRSSLTGNAPEVLQQLATLQALRSQLSSLEGSTQSAGSSDYIGKYREFKYQETLFDMFSRQYELSRLDESKEGSLIQVVDPATPPERKTSPRRAIISISTTLAAAAALSLFAIASGLWRRAAMVPSTAERLHRLGVSASRQPE
jgi:uncharacterized protein involved in exopolysaccharide biosynthesis